MVSGWPGRQYDEACSTAGPLSPRWVMSIFSRNAGAVLLPVPEPAARATTSAATPASSVHRASSPPSTSGTSAGRGSITRNPNWRARSYASAGGAELGNRQAARGHHQRAGSEFTGGG